MQPAVLQRLRQMPGPIVVDCSRLELPNTQFYRSCQDMGIHIVVSNAGTIVRLSDESASALGCEPLMTYDSCVGARVPISDTLRTLNQMGDPVDSVEASLSGTCGFVITQLMDGVPLSTAVAAAVEKGYTEPDPSFDLSGKDFARKLCVLSRQMGRRLHPSEVRLDGMVPDACIDALARACSAEEREAALKAYDTELAAEVDAARAAGERIAFVGQINFGGGAVPRVSPPRGSRGRTPSNSPQGGPVIASVRRVRVGPGHPAHGLRGVEIYASLSCEGARSRDLPIKLHGPGCGSASALGVVSDILKAALRLQGSLLSADDDGTGATASVPEPVGRRESALTPSQMLF